MEDIIKLGQLYDFYGELLTDHQKEVYEDLVYNDLSISEIASSYGISRQGAHDLIKRINNILGNYESKLGLVSRFESIKKQIESLDSLTKEEKDLIVGQL
ncbi:MAG: DNA-binding protein [Lachnospiraceae bacterium]|nr:DNA-binding protein [Lachnospiraceae bacterium]